MRANSRCELKFICGSLRKVSNPSVILLGDGPAARLLLHKTAAVLADFPEIRVEAVNKSASTVSKPPGRPAGPFVAIYATSKSAGIAALRLQLGTNPLIVVPVAENSVSGQRLLQAAAAAGAPTVALGEAGARNAALLAVSMFAAQGVRTLRKALDDFRAKQTTTVLKTSLPAI